MIVNEFEIRFKTASRDLGLYSLLSIMEDEVNAFYPDALEIFTPDLIERVKNINKTRNNEIVLKGSLSTDNPLKFALSKQFLRMMVLKMKRKYSFDFELKGSFKVDGSLSKDVNSNKFFNVLKA